MCCVVLVDKCVASRYTSLCNTMQQNTLRFLVIEWKCFPLKLYFFNAVDPQQCKRSAFHQDSRVSKVVSVSCDDTIFHREDVVIFTIADSSNRNSIFFSCIIKRHNFLANCTKETSRFLTKRNYSTCGLQRIMERLTLWLSERNTQIV